MNREPHQEGANVTDGTLRPWRQEKQFDSAQKPADTLVLNKLRARLAEATE